MKLRQPVHTSDPHPSQSRSTLLSHYCDTPSSPCLLLPLTGRLTAIPLLQMFPPTVGKSKLSFVLSELSNFYDFEKLGMFHPEQTSAGYRDTAL